MIWIRLVALRTVGLHHCVCNTVANGRNGINWIFFPAIVYYPRLNWRTKKENHKNNNRNRKRERNELVVVVQTLMVIRAVCQRQSLCYPNSVQLSLCRMAFEHLCNRFSVIRWAMHICLWNCAPDGCPPHTNSQNSLDEMTCTSTFEHTDRSVISEKYTNKANDYSNHTATQPRLFWRMKENKKEKNIIPRKREIFQKN